MHLTSSALLRFLSLKGVGDVRHLTLEDEGIGLNAAGDDLAPFGSIIAAPSVSAGLWSSTVTLPLEQGRLLRLTGANKREASAFVLEAETAWRTHNLNRLEAEADQITDVQSQIAQWNEPTVYPSACRLNPLLSPARRLEETLLSKLSAEALGAERASRLVPIRNFAKDPHQLRDPAISGFVEAELERWKDFFDTVESKPLTPEQRLSIVVDEDATLVLAGAGSGKTSVITAKAAYLLRAGIRPADEILLLAFAKDAAAEMSERI